MTIRSLLVPVDYLADGDRAFAVAVRLARATELPIELITVSSPGLDEANDAAELDLRIKSAAPVPSSWTVVHDEDPGAALARAIQQRVDALPVMGTAARGPLGELFLGSTTEAVLAHVDRPMLLVGPHVAPTTISGTDRIIVGVDSWEGAEPLLDAVTDWVTTFGSTVEVVEVISESDAESLPPDVSEVGLVRGVAAAFERRGTPARWDTARGDDPAHDLPRLADDAQASALALASARWVTDRRVHPESTAREVVRAAHVPVLLVPELIASRRHET